MSNIFIFAAVLAAAFLLSKLKRKLMQMARDMAGKKQRLYKETVQRNYTIGSAALLYRGTFLRTRMNESRI